MLKPNLFDYSDFRKYLRDVYETNKAHNARFSFRIIAAKAGFSSSASYKLVIEGARNLSKQSILKIALGFDLDARSAEYFENLVFFNQSENPKEKDHFFERMVALQKLRPMAPVSRDHLAYFGQWYHCVLREIVCMVDLPLNYNKLGAMVSPRLQPAQVRESIELLLELGFIRVSDGRYVQSEPVIGSNERSAKDVLVQFQKQMLQKAMESYERDRSDERLASSTTFGISEQSFKKFVQLTREFRGHLTDLARNDENPQRVYQLAINFFPLSESLGKSK